MPWHEVHQGRYERALGENETFIKILGDATLPLNREHWAMNVVAEITPTGTFAQENLSSLFLEAWKTLRFNHPSIAAYIVDETRYIYDIPDSAALEKWASETFKVVEDKTSDELIASITPSPYATMYYLPTTNELVAHSQHWRTDGVGGFILMDDFLALAASSLPPNASNLPWGEETSRLTAPIEEAAAISTNPTKADKELGAECVGTFGHMVDAVGIASPAPTETLPGGTRIARHQLTEQETKVVVQACKARNISVSAAVHASIAAANYAFAAPEDQSKHYTSTIRYSIRPFLPSPYSGRGYAAAIFTSGWMIPVTASSSWEERAKLYHDEYRKGLSKEFLSAHREYAIGLCDLLRSLPADAPSPTNVDISSVGVIERLLDREKGTAQRGIRVDKLSGGLDMINRQCMCQVWTFRNQLCLNLMYNEAFYEKANMEGLVKFVRDSLIEELTTC
jgi:hypothetical protein